MFRLISNDLIPGLTVGLILGLACVGVGMAETAGAGRAATLADGERLATAGDLRGALAVYRDLATADPTSAEAFARLGGMQLLDQRYREAISSFQRAITLGDDGARPFVGLGMAYLHIGMLGPARAALVEARTRSASTADVDSLIAWIDARDPAPDGTR